MPRLRDILAQYNTTLSRPCAGFVHTLVSYRAACPPQPGTLNVPLLRCRFLRNGCGINGLFQLRKNRLGAGPVAEKRSMIAMLALWTLVFLARSFSSCSWLSSCL